MVGGKQQDFPVVGKPKPWTHLEPHMLGQGVEVLPLLRRWGGIGEDARSGAAQGIEMTDQVVAPEEMRHRFRVIDRPRIGEPVDPPAVGTCGHGDPPHPGRFVVTKSRKSHTRNARERV